MSSGNLIVPAEWNGNRALVSNQQSHGADPQTFSVYTDIINDVTGRRRKRPGIGAPLGVAAGGYTSAMFEFTRTDPASGVITRYVFRAGNFTIQRSIAGVWTNCVLGGIAFTGITWQFVATRNRCFAINGVDGIFYFDGTTGPDGREWYAVGIATPTANVGYSLSAVDAPYATGTVTATKGAKLVTGSGATTWVTSGAWSSKFIDIAGVRYQIDTVTVAAPGQLNLKDEYRGETASGLTYAIYIGLMDWSEPTTYSFSYVNSASGHSSNIAPLLQITEKDIVGRTPRITSIPYSPADFNNGYDKIQLWRSAKNGSVLCEINPAAGGRINNSSGAGTTTFTETANTYRDTNLTFNTAPLISNRGPFNGTDTGPMVATTIAEWNGRLWIYSAREAKLYYSANFSAAEIAYGRAEECWPANNFLAISDGRALLRVGQDGRDALILQTGTKDRVVVGNNRINFIDRELGTDEEGGGSLNCALAIAGSFVSLYRDKRLIDYSDSDNTDIGREIQDRLNTIGDTQIAQCCMVRYTYQDRNFLLVSMPVETSMDNNATFIWDYDLKCWYRMSIGFTAFAVVHASSGALELWAARASNLKVYKLFTTATQDDGANFTPVMESVHIRPFGYGKRAFFKWSNVFVTTPSQTWSLKIFVNEDGAGETFASPVTEFRFQTAAGKKLVTPADAGHIKRGEVFKLAWIWPTVNADVVMEKAIVGWGLDQDVEGTQ